MATSTPFSGYNPWRPLVEYQAKLPGLFDTSGLQQGYNRQISDQYDIGRSLTAAATNAYVNRAAQSGQSTAGAAFAGGQAMLPYLRQANQLRTDLAGRMLQANTAQAGIGADLASRIGGLQSTRQGQEAGYQTDQQRLRQQQEQFNADLAFRQQQLAQQQSQFNANFLQRGREFDYSSGGYGGSSRYSGGGGLNYSGQGGGFNGQVTRAPNNAGTGGVEYTPQFLQYLQSQGMNAQNYAQSGPMRYPMSTGTGSGVQLDAYQNYLRTLGALSNGGPTYNQNPTELQYYRPGTFSGSTGYTRPI